MKKLYMVVAAVAFLLGGSMAVRAYEGTYEGIQFYCTITGKKSVMAFTAVGSTSTTVIIRSTAYDKEGKAIGSGGNAGGGYASTNYNVSGEIEYALQEHEVPSYGELLKIVEYAY